MGRFKTSSDFSQSFSTPFANKAAGNQAEIIRLRKKVRRLESELERERHERDALQIHQRILKIIRDPVAFIDRHYVYQAVNQVYTEMFRQPAEKIVGRSIPDLWGQSLFDSQLRKPIDRCLDGHEVNHNLWLTMPDGNRQYMDRRYYPVRGEDGHVTGAILSSRDITSLKQTEDLLTERTRDLGERIKELNCLFGISILLENPHITPDEFFGNVLQLVCSAMQFSHLAAARIQLADGRCYETPDYAPGDCSFSSEIQVRQRTVGEIEIRYRDLAARVEREVFLPEEKVLIYSVAERLGKVLQYRQTETALEESEDRFQLILAQLPVGIGIVRDDRLIYENAEMRRISCLDPEQGIKNQMARLLDSRERHRLLRSYEAIISRKIHSSETVFTFAPDPDRAMKEAVWVNCRMSRIDHQDRPAVLLTLADITRTRTMERLLAARDKMASLGRVAAGIAHEIRNPLSGITIYIDALRQIMEDADVPENFHHITDQMQEAAEKIETIIRRVMDFTKKSEMRFSPVRVNEPVKRALAQIRPTLDAYDIRVETYLDPDLPLCQADPTLLEQVIFNLLNNAVEAILEESSPDRGILIETGLNAGDTVISVEDSGPGIPSQRAVAVFDPFFTTKSHGMGIGLSLCQRIITAHGGRLETGPSSLDGARFTVRIPLSSEVYPYD